MNLTFCSDINELYISHEEATNKLSLEGVNSAGEPFDKGENYFSMFLFDLSINSKYLHYTFILNSNTIFISNIKNNINFSASEFKFTDENIHITQNGPLYEISNNHIFSNSPTDYNSQQIQLKTPEDIENIKIGIQNTIWSSFSENNAIYFSMMILENLLEATPNEWNTELYMMNNINNDYSNSTSITLCHYIDNYTDSFKRIYSTAPFHCIDGNIGSFWNTTPLEIDYLSPVGEQLVFGEAPIYFSTYTTNYNNLLYIVPEPKGFNQEIYSYSDDFTAATLINSSGDVITTGGLSCLFGLDLPDDNYILTVEKIIYDYTELPGKTTMINKFNTALESIYQPKMNAFVILNEDNVPSNILEFPNEATLLFTLTDMEVISNEYFYNPILEDSVKVYYKLHNENDWSEINNELISEYTSLGWATGKTFSVNIGEIILTDSSAYDLKIYFEDDDHNSSEIIIEPAFIVGNYNFVDITHEDIQDNPNDKLLINYPNPFKPLGNRDETSTTILFSIPKYCNQAHIEIYNIKGQCIRQLKIKTLNSGINEISWDGRNQAGKIVSSGIYFYKLQIDGKTEAINKCLLIK